MTLRTPFEFPIDPPPPDGEMMVSVADPLDSAPGDATYYMARRFDFSEGNYTIAVAADDAATFWLGTSELNSLMIGSAVLGTPGIAYLNIPQGKYRLDVILQNLPPTPSPCYFTMVIKRGEELIYTSGAEGWKLDDSPISDGDIPPGEDYRKSLPVFSVLPNWDQGITERLSWLTDVMVSETDSEQRRSVRRNARRTFEANFMRVRSQRDRLDTFFVGIGPSQFMMPLWHEAVRMKDGIDMEAGGVTIDDGQLYMREFRTGDLVFVNAGNPDVYDVLEVGVVEENRFSWAFPPPRSWPVGTRIYPMRVANIVDTAPSMSNVTDTTATASVLFQCVEPYSVPASWGGATPSGTPLFHFRPQRADPIAVQYGRRNYTLDNDSGVPITLDHGRFTNAQVSFSLVLDGRAEGYAFRQFLQAARGMSKHFYMPTFMQDIEPLGDIGAGAQLFIRPQGFGDYMLRPQPLRLQLGFQFKNGSPTLYRLITNVTPIYKMNPDGLPANPLQVVAEMFTLDTALPAIALKQLVRISFVVETRFAQDQFELHHSTNDQRWTTTALVFRQAQNPRIAT